ncbi:MAG: hypothetical protein QOF11_1445 [Chloroflexota bacterium]|jgi:hypothetical protein|nr:hypothetical protein [Chloroflexota bacterium]
MTPPDPIEPKRRMPTGVRIFLIYAAAILVVIGLSLRFVIDTAISTPVSLLGLVVMILLAYTIFTITLVLQRKRAARGLAIALASLTLPAVPLGFFSFTVASTGMAVALFCSALAIALFRGLLRPDVEAYLDQT